jgi:hypothetical protein
MDQRLTSHKSRSAKPRQALQTDDIFSAGIDSEDMRRG